MQTTVHLFRYHYALWVNWIVCNKGFWREKCINLNMLVNRSIGLWYLKEIFAKEGGVEKEGEDENESKIDSKSGVHMKFLLYAVRCATYNKLKSRYYTIIAIKTLLIFSCNIWAISICFAMVFIQEASECLSNISIFKTVKKDSEWKFHAPTLPHIPNLGS